MSSLWIASRSGFSWHSYDVTACLLAILGLAVNAPSAAAAHARFGLSVTAGVLVLAAAAQHARHQREGVAHACRWMTCGWVSRACRACASANGGGADDGTAGLNPNTVRTHPQPGAGAPSRHEV